MYVVGEISAPPPAILRRKFLAIFSSITASYSALGVIL
jgi:hypothetical protein